jgi:'Cold-shock' DNA-binding domain
MASGTVKWFDPNKGYGFIRPDRAHPPALAARRPEPASGAACRGGGRKGRWAGC